MFHIFDSIKKALSTMKNLEDILIRKEVISNLVFRSATESSPLCSPVNDVLVSLTTYSKRIFDVHLVIESLGMQTLKPGRIILWLDEDEFNSDNIPVTLQRLVERGLEIKYCKNIRSYKKIIPSLEMYMDNNIITIDDDVIYPYRFIELFLHESESYTNTVLCFRAHKIKYTSNGDMLPYLKWDLETKSREPGDDIFPTGNHGVYYPKNAFYKDATDESLFMRLAPSADDVWLKFKTLQNGFKAKVIDTRSIEYFNFIELTLNQNSSLNALNVTNNENDVQIKNVIESISNKNYRL